MLDQQREQDYHDVNDYQLCYWFGGGGRNANAVLEKPMRGLWGTCIVTAKGTDFNEDLRNENEVSLVMYRCSGSGT